MFRFRRWCNDRKRIDTATPDGKNPHNSVQDIEPHMPPLRGESADFQKHVEYLEVHQLQLQACYNMTFRKHQWDQQRAKDEEFAAITNQIFGLVGGSLGRPRKKDDDQGPGENVLFVIGLGDFKSTRRLTSLHGSFCSYFVNKDTYTSMRCPECHQFVCQEEIRPLYCPTCKTRFHRDVMAAENMCNIARGYLQDLKRPDYLQPIDRNGALIWEQSAAASNSGTSSVSNSTSMGGNRKSRRVTVPSSNNASGSTKADSNRKRRRATVPSINDNAGSSAAVGGGSRKRRRPMDEDTATAH